MLPSFLRHLETRDIYGSARIHAAAPRCPTLIGRVHWDHRSIPTCTAFRKATWRIPDRHTSLPTFCKGELFVVVTDTVRLNPSKRRCRVLGHVLGLLCKSYLTSPHVCGSVGFARSQRQLFLGHLLLHKYSLLFFDPFCLIDLTSQLTTLAKPTNHSQT